MQGLGSSDTACTVHSMNSGNFEALNSMHTTDEYVSGALYPPVAYMYKAWARAITRYSQHHPDSAEYGSNHVPMATYQCRA